MLARSSTLLVVLGLAVLGAGSTGCSGDGADEGSASASAFTVENGDRFVVSATSERIVLAKKVRDVVFPFDQSSLRGKAILIHPVVRKVDEGVYARALDVRIEGATYVIDARPLTLEEMSDITEDEVVRIYIDRRSAANTNEREPEIILSPATLLRPLGSGTSGSGRGASGLGFGSAEELGSPSMPRPGISFTHTIEKASLDPEALIDWSREGGLELGLKTELAWKSKAAVRGTLSGEFFRSKTLEGPPIHGFVPIGPVPVPVSLQGKAWIACSAAGVGPAEVGVEIEASARLAASLRVSPKRGVAVSEWVHEGRWPATANGSFTATPSVEAKFSATISCAVPRLEVHASIAGVAGPYVAMTPTIKLNENGTTVEVPIAVGVRAGVLGVGSGAEVMVYSWKP